MLFFRALFTLFAYDVLSTFCRFETIYSMVKRWTVASAASWSRHASTVSARRSTTPASGTRNRLFACSAPSSLRTCSGSTASHAHMVLGAQKLPFKAHAWVEVDGQAINERSNVQATYAVWDRC